MFTLALLIFAFDLISPKDIKLGIFSDIHMNLRYNASTSANWCTWSDTQDANDNKTSKTQNPNPIRDNDPLAPLGRLGCDAPKILVEYMLQLFNNVTADEPVDMIILNGDLISHGVSQDVKDPYSYKTYQLLKTTHFQLAYLFQKYLPHTPIFLTLGNNDAKFHYSSPFPEDKEEYFNFMFDYFFKWQPGNQPYLSSIESTWKDGGYYRIDASDNLSLLAFNTLPYNNAQVMDKIGPEAENQWKWLEAQLSEKSDRKFIIFTHIYAGGRVKQNDKLKLENLWREDENERYMFLMIKYADRVVIELAGHDHWEDFRVLTDDLGHYYRNLFIATGIGLNHHQLPGFNTLKINSTTLKPYELKETILDITESYNRTVPLPLANMTVRTIDFAKQMNLTQITPEGIHNLMQSFDKDDKTRVLHYLSDRLGFDHTDPAQYAYGLQLAASWSLINKEHTNSDAFFCQNTHNFNKDQLNDCLKNRRDERIRGLVEKEEEARSKAQKFIN